MKKPSSLFYKGARKLGKIGSTLNDVETLLTLNPEKIVKRSMRKRVWKERNKNTKKITRFLK